MLARFAREEMPCVSLVKGFSLLPPPRDFQITTAWRRQPVFKQFFL
jgi:hypothetical protein